MKVEGTPLAIFSQMQKPDQTEQTKQAFAPFVDRAASGAAATGSTGQTASDETTGKTANVGNVQASEPSPGLAENAESMPTAQVAEKVDASSISNFLSDDEKEMLARLFPPPGREFGIRAYREGQKPTPKEQARGRQIDLST